jgi:zinc transport system permease protein
LIEFALSEILRLLGYRFFQYALLGGIVSALTCAWVGLFLVLRKEVMIGDGIAHTAFGGVAIGLFLGIDPVFAAFLISVLAVFGVSYMRKKGLASSDSAIAMMLALGFSTGLIVISLAGGFNVELFSYLFGSILTIDEQDLLVIAILGISTILFMELFHKELLSITFDEEDARLAGLPIRPLSIAFNMLVATTIALSIKVIGIILVVALLVIPGLSALQLSLPFKKTVVATVGFAIVSMVTGILLSAILNVATSGVIIFTAAAFFLLTTLYKRLG